MCPIIKKLPKMWQIMKKVTEKCDKYWKLTNMYQMMKKVTQYVSNGSKGCQKCVKWCKKCGKHLLNVVALYIKCLRAFFDYL